MIGVLEMPLDWRFSWGNRVSVFCLLVFGVEGGSLRRGKRRSKEGNRKFVQFAIQTKLIIFSCISCKWRRVISHKKINEIIFF